MGCSHPVFFRASLRAGFMRGLIVSLIIAKGKIMKTVSKRQYRHASAIFRTHGWKYTFNFFQSYPERLDVLLRIFAYYPERIESLRREFTCHN